jgi:prolyl-tRNA editing enzyme YbaK/EbsC (Cys-tRNA(Pro) deacylase)
MIPNKVQKVLDAYGLKAIEFEEGSTPTAVTAAEKLGVTVGNIAKSLLFIGKDGRYAMVICPGDRRVSNAKLKQVLGVKTRMAGPEEVTRLTGFPPGGVCPFGVAGVEILLDQRLGSFETIYPAAGTDSSGVPMSFETLKAITGGGVFDLTSE